MTTPEPATSPSSATRLPVFRAGRHRAMEGREVSFGAGELADIAASYDASAHAAPLVIGHPRLDAPAYGWVGALSVEGDRLIADFSEISEAARDLVREGHYRHVSASFYAPDAAANPTPGRWHLRHVGLLGATPPAVKGLGAVSFSTADAVDVVTVSFSELSSRAAWSMAALARSVGRLMRRSRERVVAEQGLEAADREMPEWDVASTEEVAARLTAEAEALAEAERAAPIAPDPLSFAAPAAPSSPEPSMSPEEIAAEIAALQAENARLAAQNASFAEAEAARVRAARAGEDRAFVAGLVTAGRLPPGRASEVASFLERLDDGEAVSFCEGGEPHTARAFFKALLGGAAPVLSFGESAPAAQDRPVPGEAAAIAKAIDAKIAAAAQRGETLSYADAVGEFRSQGA
jgi:hypothetical protein